MNPLFLPANLERAERLLAVLREVADAHGVTPSQAALAYVVHHPNVVAIPGASSAEQVEANAAAADVVLADDEYEALRTAARPSGRSPGWRRCRSCWRGCAADTGLAPGRPVGGLGEVLDPGKPGVPLRGDLRHHPGRGLEPLRPHLVERFAAFPPARHEPGPVEDREVFGDGLPGEGEVPRERRRRRLAVREQQVEDVPAGRVTDDRPEFVLVRRHARP